MTHARGMLGPMPLRDTYNDFAVVDYVDRPNGPLSHVDPGWLDVARVTAHEFRERLPEARFVSWSRPPDARDAMQAGYDDDAFVAHFMASFPTTFPWEAAYAAGFEGRTGTTPASFVTSSERALRAASAEVLGALEPGVRLAEHARARSRAGIVVAVRGPDVDVVWGPWTRSA